MRWHDVPRGTMDEVRSQCPLDLPSVRRQGRPIDWSTPFSNPMMEGPRSHFGEKHEPASDIDTAAVDSLKALDPNRPIREADIYGPAFSKMELFEFRSNLYLINLAFLRLTA